jgi:hypothetical protein
VHNTLLGGWFGRKSKCNYAIEAALLAKEIGTTRLLRGAPPLRAELHAKLHARPEASAGDRAGARLGRCALRYPQPAHRVRGRAEAHTRIGWFRSVDNIAHAFSIQYAELIGPARIVDLSKQVTTPCWNNGEPTGSCPIDTGRLRHTRRAPYCCASTTLSHFSRGTGRTPEFGLGRKEIWACSRPRGNRNGRNFASAFMRGRVHNRNRERGDKPFRRLGVGHEHMAPGSSGGPGALLPRRDARRQTALTMSLITAMLMFVPSLHAQGTLHYLGTPAPAPAPAPEQHLAQQYDPPSLPPEIMVPERRPVGRQRSAPPITVVPLDPLPPEPTPATPPPAPTVPVESNPLIEWCRQETNAKVPMCRNVGSPRVQR